MKIYLMRHGETEYNKRKLFYGSLNPPLNSTGIRQGQILHKKFQKLPAETLVYTSSLSRTIETAELVFPTQKKIALPAFNEKDFGCWEGLSANQIEKKYPLEWENWLAQPFEVTPPLAENYASFKARVLQCYNQITVCQKDLVVVGHMGVLRVIITACFPKIDFWEIVIDQGKYISLECVGGAYKIINWNV